MFTLGHHAQLIEGDWGAIRSPLVKRLEQKFAVSTKGNPDYVELVCETFGINDGRELQSLASRKSFGDRQVFVIVLDGITREAQNSLLKLFEEPSADTYFFVITPSATIFLPTLLSRMHVTRSQAGESRKDKVSNFLRAKPAQRLTLVRGLLEKQDKKGAKELLEGVEEAISIAGKDRPVELKKYAVTLREIVKMKRYLRGRGSSVKQILEHVSLITPNL
jgi:hypothetical protein